MSSIKISELPVITAINANTANTIFVGLDVPTNVTGKMTLTTLAHGLYSNNNLLVGNTNVILPGAVAQYTGTNDLYIQTSLQNLSPNGSGDIVVTADNGTDTTYFMDMGLAGSNYTFAGDSLNKPNDGYMIMVGDTQSAPGGNLTIGTLTDGKDIIFVQGNLNEANVVGRFIHNTGFKLTRKPLIFADGTSQNSAVDYVTVNSRVSSNISIVNNSITTNVAALNGSITANGASANSVINTRITANIATVNLFTQSAFDKANNALANTTGTLNGSLTILHDLTVNGSVTFANSGFSNTEALVTISAANNGLHQLSGGDGYVLHLTGKYNTPTRIVGDSFSGANGQNTFVLYGGRAARGNVEYPTAVQTDDVLVRLSGTSYGTTKYQTGGAARIDIVATENHTDIARGTAIKFYNILEGQNNLSQIATFNANTVSLSGVVIPQKGFAYTPNNITSNATSYTIDFKRDSMIRMSANDNMSISLTNFQTGKIVEVWITNNANQNKTITHGCLANNSTAKSTTFTIQASACAFLKYFSIDGDQPNTFVSITA